MPDHTDKLLLDLVDLSSWLQRHAARHEDQRATDEVFVHTVWRAIGRIESTSKTDLGQVLVVLSATILQLEHVMSAISDFSTKVNAAFDTLGTAVDGLTTDVQTLNDTIKKLQDSAGTVTPEDQALLDEIQTRAQGVADKAKALDDLTAAPPTPPAP